MKPVSHRAKLKGAKRAAEKSFDRWWKAKDRWAEPIQLVWPVAFLAGVRWQKRQGQEPAKRVAELVRAMKNCDAVDKDWLLEVLTAPIITGDK